MIMLTIYITVWLPACPHTSNVLLDKFGPCAVVAEFEMLHLPLAAFRELMITNYVDSWHTLLWHDN